MKITLIFPSIRNYGGFNSLGKTSTSIYINHGLASISAVLKQRGHVVDLIDLRECSSWVDVTEKIKSSNSDVYGVYFQTLDFYEAKKCAEIIHGIGKISIAGGPHPSIVPNHVLENTLFDYVFVGEAEETLLELLDELSTHNSNKGFSSFSNSSITADRLLFGVPPDLDSLPIEDRELFNMKKILSTKHGFFQKPFVSVISGRGCPFNCSFCKPGEDKIFGKFRQRSVENLVGEIFFLQKKYSYNMLMIDDDAFTVNPDYVHDFCTKYGKLSLPFTCQTRADFIVQNPNLVKKMKDVGLWMFVIGFESGNQRILNLLRKGTTVETNIEAAKICNRFGIKIWANIMYGIPTETKEEVIDTMSMVRKIKPYTFSGSFFTPIIGTDLYSYCLENDLMLSEDPVVLGSRSPNEPKIIGPDYVWLDKQIKKMKFECFRNLSFEDKISVASNWLRRKFSPNIFNHLKKS